jgi:hypothetical protein
MMKDLHNNIKVSRAISPVAAAPTGNTAIVSEILDTANFGSAEFVAALGSIADADVTFTLLFEDGDNSSLTDNAAVADEHLLGVESAVYVFGDDNKTFKIGYIGPKRYVRVTITPANNTGNHCMSAVWIQSHPRNLPQSTQVV